MRTRIAAVAAATWLAVPLARAEPERPALTYHRLYLRGGFAYLAPMVDSSELELSGVDGPASLAIMNGPVAGSGVSIDPVTVPGLTVGYVLPIAGDHFALETVLGLPFRARFRATGTLADTSLGPDAIGIPTGIPPLGSELGEADAAPPDLTVVYRTPHLGPITPYLGTGIAVLFTYNAHATNRVLTEVARPTFTVDPAAGWVLQSGIDIALWRLRLRAELRYVAFRRAHATVSNIEVRTPDLPLLETAKVGTATMDLWLNPLILMVGVGVDF